jgi:protein FrlC
MRLSLWSGFFAALEPEQAMQEIASAGFRFAELSCEMALDPGKGYFSRSWMERLRDACRSCGLRIPQVHYPIHTVNPQVKREGEWSPEWEADLAHPEEWRRSFELQCVRDLIELCPIVGVETIVVHPGGCRGVADERESRRALELNVEAFSRLAGAAAARGVVLALENMGRVRDVRQFGSRIRDLLDVIGSVPARGVAVCLDTGHAHYMGEDVPSAVAVLGDRLRATHIHDSLGRRDDHLMPYSGTIDWGRVISALKGIGYQGMLNLEIPGESRCPLPFLRLKARHAFRMMETLAGAGTGGAGDAQAPP